MEACLSKDQFVGSALEASISLPGKGAGRKEFVYHGKLNSAQGRSQVRAGSVTRLRYPDDAAAPLMNRVIDGRLFVSARG
jgi:hypothetical protein